MSAHCSSSGGGGETGPPEMACFSSRKNPGSAHRRPANHGSADAAGQAAFQIGGACDIAVSDNGNARRGPALRDRLPVRLAAVALLLRAAMDRHRLNAAVFQKPGRCGRVDRLRIPADPVFAVTGTGATARTTARATRSSNGQSRSRDEPPFFETTLFTGQPKFRSMKSGRFHSTIIRAASPKCPDRRQKSHPQRPLCFLKFEVFERALVLPKHAFRGNEFRHQ